MGAIVTNWQRTQINRLRTLFVHAQTLPDEPMRKLCLRLLQLTEAVEVLHTRPRQGGSHHHVAGLIADLEKTHLNV